MEPGMAFRERRNRCPYTFVGIDPVVSRFAGVQRVTVRTAEGASWICDKYERFPLMVAE
jgi:hypothetical protein